MRLLLSARRLPGHKITKTLGFTWGLIVQHGASAATSPRACARLPGGEGSRGTTSLLFNQSREEALLRLREHAKALGANAVIGVAFDSSRNRRRHDQGAGLRHCGGCRTGDGCGKPGQAPGDGPGKWLPNQYPDCFSQKHGYTRVPPKQAFFSFPRISTIQKED